MTEQERIRKQRDLAERDRDFQRRQRELREDFNQRRNEELQKLLRQANTVIKNIAQRESMTSFFRRPSTSTRRLISLTGSQGTQVNFYRAQADQDVCLLLNCHLVQYVRHDLTRVSATSNLLSLSDRPHKFFK